MTMRKRETLIALAGGMAASLLPDWWPGGSDDSEESLQTQIDDLQTEVTKLDNAMQAIKDEQLNQDSRIDTLEADGGNGIVSASYTGDGTSTGREIDMGTTLDWAIVVADDSSEVERYEATQLGADVATKILGGALTDSIEVSSAVWTSANGVTVGDGSTDGNADTVGYHVIGFVA